MTKRVTFAAATDADPQNHGGDDGEIDFISSLSPADLYVVMGKQIVDCEPNDAIELYMQRHPDADREQVTAEIEACCSALIDHAVDPRSEYSPADLFNAMCKWTDDDVQVEDAIALYMELHPEADREAVIAEIEAFAAQLPR